MLIIIFLKLRRSSNIEVPILKFVYYRLAIRGQHGLTGFTIKDSFSQRPASAFSSRFLW